MARQQGEAGDCGETSGTWELTLSTRHEQGRSHVGRSCCQQGLCQAGLVASDGQGQDGGALCEDATPGVEEDGAHGDDAMARGEEEGLWWLGPTRLCEIVVFAVAKAKGHELWQCGYMRR